MSRRRAKGPPTRVPMPPPRRRRSPVSRRRRGVTVSSYASVNDHTPPRSRTRDRATISGRGLLVVDRVRLVGGGVGLLVLLVVDGFLLVAGAIGFLVVAAGLGAV